LAADEVVVVVEEGHDDDVLKPAAEVVEAEPQKNRQ